MRTLEGPVLEAARSLLGRRLVSDVGGRTAVVITEVEAYDGANDPASHAYRGETPRNASMFLGPGTLYVYRSYGVHWCMNVVCGPEGVASAVLLRGGIPIEGEALMDARRRSRRPLATGPGNLAQALGVTGDLDGSSVYDGPVRIEGEPVPGIVSSSPRVGISRAVDRPWRFTLSTDR
ncbi:MAG TPA: DNA-3-methyladenine glycosylase [Acidimicrobiia bacterium]|nr:DNA-3-methyladenine glycosylase [Acidimicrobiia bacterium]